MDMRSIRVGAGVGGAHVLLEYVVTEEERSLARFRLSCNRRPVSAFSSECAAVNMARVLSSLHRTDEAVVISVRRLDGEVRVVESSPATDDAGLARTGSAG